MQQKPIKRLGELYKPSAIVFQFWLAVLSFSLFIASTVEKAIRRWWEVPDLTLVGWVAYAIGSIVVIVTVIFSIWAIVSLVIMFFKSFITPKTEDYLKAQKESLNNLANQVKNNRESYKIIGDFLNDIDNKN